MKSTSDTYIPEEIMSFSDLKLFALSSNQELAKRVAQEIGIELGKSSVRQFSDGEIQVNIEESIRGKHVFILQSTSSPVNDNLLEILIMVDALKRAVQNLSMLSCLTMGMHVRIERRERVSQSLQNLSQICLK